MKKSIVALAAGAALVVGNAMAGDQVNVNTAQSAAIAKALGVGENIGARVVADREEKGPFKSTDDLAKRVRGLDAKAVEKNKGSLKI